MGPPAFGPWDSHLGPWDSVLGGVSKPKLETSLEDFEDFFAGGVPPGEVTPPLGDCESGTLGCTCEMDGCLVRSGDCVLRGFVPGCRGGSFGNCGFVD